MADNAFTRWWKKGSLGEFDTDVTVSNTTLIKVAITIVVVFFLIFLIYRNFNNKNKKAGK